MFAKCTETTPIYNNRFVRKHIKDSPQKVLSHTEGSLMTNCSKTNKRSLKWILNCAGSQRGDRTGLDCFSFIH